MLKYIRELNFKDLTKLVKSVGKRDFVAKDLMHWLYKKQVHNFSEMTSMSKKLIEYLNENFKLDSIKLKNIEKSKEDGTVKFLFELEDKNTIESVFIPKESSGASASRYTICVSSQVGCKMDCKFCKTGEMGFIRNLKAHEIVEQLVYVNEYILKENLVSLGNRKDNRLISNIVYMGMGEPLDNYDNLIKSIQIITDDRGFGIGKRKITVSTAGIVPKLKDLYHDTGVRIAISLNETTDFARTKIMPINQKWKIENIINSIKELPLKHHEFVTIEYVMFGGINDSSQHARELAKLLKDLKVKINLIPYNSFEGSDFVSTTDKKLHVFYDILVKNGLVCNVRYSKGKDINAACGQLKSKLSKQ